MIKEGDRIELISMVDDPDPVPNGTQGTVVFVNETSMGFTQVDVSWDNGRTLMLCTPPDQFRVISSTTK